MIRCRCIGGRVCPVQVRFDLERKRLLFTDPSLRETEMHLDANAVSELMAELGSMLAAMGKGRTDGQSDAH